MNVLCKAALAAGVVVGTVALAVAELNGRLRPNQQGPSEEDLDVREDINGFYETTPLHLV